MKDIKNNSINSNAYAYLKSFLSPDVHIIDVEIRNGWLRAEVGHNHNLMQANISFSVRNKDVD